VLEAVPVKYRAFLSYSHKDMSWARWLHVRLEQFRIDKDLVGRNTARGRVPEALRPIFRDREDFSGGHTLTDATVAAIDASAALIVLCSTTSAARPAVNEEVRLFRSRHPDRPVIPVIVDGAWPDNFPPALRYALASDGVVTDHLVTILGPDLRENADGKDLGLAKIVAGLTGLAADDIFRRAERERRKQGRVRAAVATLIVALAIVGGDFYWRSHQQEQTLAEIATLVAKYSLITPAEAAAPGTKVSLKQAITTIAEGAATDPRYADALALLKAGKAAEAEPLLKAVAEDKAKRADKDAKDAAAAYRNLASIAAISEPGRAREYYAEAARLDPSDIEGMLKYGWFQEQAGQLDVAQAAYSRVIAEAPRADDNNLLMWAKFGIGDIAAERSDLAASLATYQEAEAIADRLAKSDPGNADWQHDLAASYNRVGDVQVARGNLQAALASYQAGFAIAERLAKSVAGNADWERDRLVSYLKVGDVQVRQGNLQAALVSYQAGFAIAERLAKSDPGNAAWQRDLSDSYLRVGDVQVPQGNSQAALASYQAGFAIAERLAKSDPGNAVWQRNLSVSYSKVGDVQVARGDSQAALASYQAGFAIAERLAKSDPGNAVWQRDLSFTYGKLGSAYRAAKQPPEARKAFASARAVIAPLIEKFPGQSQWRQDFTWYAQQIEELDAIGWIDLDKLLKN
jgi:tetratricopeptide (TPR) repeat protein